ncbi:hypothetical protein Bca4012_076844 [Brassica carinata]|uniref:Uncharacterized protein n=1 Tax=Brassica carinata TaxID=52824 RepID=A0A8X7QC09_BRACI|nr:hypothetical protein Bca52824_072889 [Brassica carinata]
MGGPYLLSRSPVSKLQTVQALQSSFFKPYYRLEPNERSPIRTLSEDRIHVSLCLGPLLLDTTDETEESGELPVHPALSSKAAGKREVRKQKGHSPLQGVSMKRRCLTLGYNIHVES